MIRISVGDISSYLNEAFKDINMSSSDDLQVEYSEERLSKIEHIISRFRNINFSANQKNDVEYISTGLKTLKSMCKKQTISMHSLARTIDYINQIIYNHFRVCNFNASDQKYAQFASAVGRLFPKY